MNAKVIVINNRKGGVGKTTATLAVGSILARCNYKVLVVDLESNNNLTTGCLPFPAIEAQRRFVYDAIDEFCRGEHDVKMPVFPAMVGMDISASNRNLAGVESTLTNLPAGTRLTVLKNLLEACKEKYDFIFLDCPPTAGLLTLNAYKAADKIFIPAKLEDDSFEGARDLIIDLKKYIIGNEKLEDRLGGIFFNEFDPFPLIHRDIKNNFNRYFGPLMMKSNIRKNVAIKEAKRCRRCIVDYDPKSNAAKDYIALTQEILKKL